MRWLYPLLGALLLVGCEPDFPSPAFVEGYRVLGVVADPPAVGPTDTVSLSLIEGNANGAEYEWSVCLISLGSDFGFQCLDESLEIPLQVDGPSVTVSLGEDGIDLFTTLITALSALEAENEATETASDDDDCGEACIGRDGREQTFLDLQFRIKSGPRDGRNVETVKLVRVHFDDMVRNRNPQFTNFEVVTTPPYRAETYIQIDFAHDTSLIDSYLLANGSEITEEAIINWYSTAGKFVDAAESNAEDQPVSLASDDRVFLKMPQTLPSSPIVIWGVLRDGRGGLDFRTETLELSSPP